ncbi:outer membrane protein assembly factor BamB family protein [Deinococcus cellulosilyticus]|nr:PQQ-binding-like beta-propeller repeat protein [Deinococcus cellulosilyticus]
MKQLILTLLLALPLAHAQSLTFRGDARHSGTYQTSGPETLQGVKWKFQTGGPVRSTPAVTADALYFGSNDGTFYAVKRDSGELLWKHQTTAPINSSATVQDGKVYFGGHDGYLYALDQQTGQPIWKLQLDAEQIYPYDEWDFFSSSPVIENGILYIGSDMGAVYAVDAATGTEVWKSQLPAKSPMRSTPTVVGDQLIVAGYDKNFYSLDRKTGEVQWTRIIFNIGQSTASTDGKNFFVGLRGSTSAQGIDLKNGESLWVFPDSPSWVPSSPAYDQGMVYIGGSDSHNLYAIKADTGAKVWAYNTDGYLFSSPAVTPSMVFTGSYDNTVYGVDRSTGQLKWKFTTGDHVVSSPVPFGNELYIGSDDGFLYALH